MTLINEIHSHNTRKWKNLNIYISNFLACNSSNSLTVNSIKIWNELPNNIGSEKKLKSFKRLLYDYLLNAYEL